LPSTPPGRRGCTWHLPLLSPSSAPGMVSLRPPREPLHLRQWSGGHLIQRRKRKAIVTALALAAVHLRHSTAPPTPVLPAGGDAQPVSHLCFFCSSTACAGSSLTCASLCCHLTRVRCACARVQFFVLTMPASLYGHGEFCAGYRFLFSHPSILPLSLFVVSFFWLDLPCVV
jgi:hypothetical protein